MLTMSGSNLESLEIEGYSAHYEHTTWGCTDPVIYENTSLYRKVAAQYKYDVLDSAPGV